MSLEINHLSVVRDKAFVLWDISFAIADHETWGIIGPSGCGKTTLVKAILGLIRHDTQGSISYEHQLMQQNERMVVPINERFFGYVPQDLALWPHLSVEKTLSLALTLSGNTTDTIADIMSLTGLIEQAPKRPHQLSGGQKKRLALARALAIRPKLLVLDEPFSGLDTVAKQALINTILGLKQRRQFPVILISHDLAEIRALANNIMVLHQGQCYWQGPLHKLTHQSFPSQWNPLAALTA